MTEGEAYEYFETFDERKCFPTAYALFKGVGTGAKGTCIWWLCSKDFDYYEYAYVTDYDGSIYYYYDNDDSFGIRPSLWVDLEA